MVKRTILEAAQLRHDGKKNPRMMGRRLRAYLSNLTISAPSDELTALWNSVGLSPVFFPLNVSPYSLILSYCSTAAQYDFSTVKSKELLILSKGQHKICK